MGNTTQLSAETVQQQVPSTVQSLLRDYDAFIFDCDGTLYQAGTLLPHVAEAIPHLRSLGKKIAFITNTSSRSSQQLHNKLTGLGVPCEVSECLPSCTFTAHHVKDMHPEAKHVYVIGGQGVIDELAQVGITADGGPQHDKETFSDAHFNSMAEAVAAKHYDGVVVGWDTAFNFYKLTWSSLVFQLHPECFFYATNDDAADRIGKHLVPGNGCVLPAIEAACLSCVPSRGRKSQPYNAKAVSLGKPNPDFARWAGKRLGVDLKRTVMVGDRLDTDIDFGLKAGLGTLFVLTGVDDLGQVTEKRIRPLHVLPQVGDIWLAKL